MVTCYALVDGAATMWLATGALADAPVGMVSFDAPRRATKRGYLSFERLLGLQPRRNELKRRSIERFVRAARSCGRGRPRSR